MDEWFGYIVNIVFALFMAVVGVLILVRIIKNSLAKVKQAQAVVIDKQCFQKPISGKSSTAFPKNTYIVTFLCGNKKKHFEVSEFSYNGYRVNEKGILKYKGTRLIDFVNR